MEANERENEEEKKRSGAKAGPWKKEVPPLEYLSGGARHPWEFKICKQTPSVAAAPIGGDFFFFHLFLYLL